MSHVEFITSTTRLVREHGAAAALDEIRLASPAIAEVGYHDTLAVFFVWAVDRLVRAGLSDLQVLWHPLTDPRTPLSWWDADTLASPEARLGFFPCTLARAGEPVPHEPRLLIAA